MTDTAARGIESYRDRMQRYLMEYVEERMDRVEEHLDKGRSTHDFNRILVAITLVNCLLWIAVYLHVRRSPAPSHPHIVYMSPPVSPARDQSVPKRGDSLERVEQALMDATPLLLFDPETNIVEGIYSPSPSADDDDHKLPVDT